MLITEYWTNVQPREFRSFGSLIGKRNWFTALKHFKNYAYERNVSGAANRYRQIAEKAISCLQTGSQTCDPRTEARIWDEFKTACANANIKFNPTVDPLKPSTGNKKNLVRFAADVCDGKDTTVAEWAFRMISENRLSEAHIALKSVWGIGDKIASFYLRDIFWLGHDLNPRAKVDNDHLLQPIDIWVRRAAEELGHRSQSAESVAKFVSAFEKSKGVAHGGGNISFWMLGGRYLANEKEFRTVIKAVARREVPGSPDALAIARRFEQFGAALRKLLNNE